LEELIYWGIILIFYLFSAYRSKQKKDKNQETLIPKGIPKQKKEPKQPDFSIFEFLDDAIENSSINLDRLPQNNEQGINSNMQKMHRVNREQDLDLLLSEKDEINNINDKKIKSKYNIKDKHLSHLETRINVGDKNKKSSSEKLLSIQKKLRNEPTKLAIVMQAIFDPPKSQGI